MIINDLVYGEFKVEEPVLLDLTNSPSVQRLKGISQFGLPDQYHTRRGFSRYDHSVGVFLLLRKMGAPLEEQVAGLLHDISQFSFSHLSDWIFGKGAEGDESYHDSRHADFVMASEVPKILEKYGLSVERILDEENFPLLENELPDICADRIDYSLREVALSGRKEITNIILRDLKVKNGQYFFKDQESGRLFADSYLDLQLNNWASDEIVKRFFVFARAFKIAISEGQIKHDDFWEKTEDELLEALFKSGNKEITSILKNLGRGKLEQNSGKKVFKKFRYIDPLIKHDKKFSRLTEIDSDYREKIEREKEKNSLGLLV